MVKLNYLIYAVTCVLLCQLITYSVQVPTAHIRQTRQSNQETDIDNRFWEGRRPNTFGQGGQVDQGNQGQNGQGQGQTNSNQGNPGTPQQTPSPSGSSTVDPNCEKDICLSTNEFNPVCGNNNQTYANIGKLECATYCGVAVQFGRYGSC